MNRLIFARVQKATICSNFEISGKVIDIINYKLVVKY